MPMIGHDRFKVLLEDGPGLDYDKRKIYVPPRLSSDMRHVSWWDSVLRAILIQRFGPNYDIDDTEMRALAYGLVSLYADNPGEFDIPWE